MNQLLESCCDSLDQIVVITLAVFDVEQSQSTEIYQKTRLGCHVRHVLDHYDALLQGVADGQIDYNRRNRNSAIETDIAVALSAITTLQTKLRMIEEDKRAFTVISEINCSYTIIQSFGSTLARELLYLMNHTIHHTAYMKLLIQPYDINLANPIGIAPGTATFLRNGG
jgi:hypothetical protein